MAQKEIEILNSNPNKFKKNYREFPPLNHYHMPNNGSTQSTASSFQFYSLIRGFSASIQFKSSINQL